MKWRIICRQKSKTPGRFLYQITNDVNIVDVVFYEDLYKYGLVKFKSFPQIKVFKLKPINPDYSTGMEGRKFNKIPTLKFRKMPC